MRKRRSRSGAAGDAVKCRMCGQVVAVGSDGRCPLGHFVGLPRPEAAPAPVPVPEPAPASEPVAAGVTARPAQVPAAPLLAAPVPAAPVGDTRAPAPEPQPAPAALAAPAQPPAGAATAPEAGPAAAPEDDLTSDLLADFGDLDVFGDLEVDGRNREVAPGAGGMTPQPATLTDPRQAPPGIDDLLGWRTTASALDATLPGPSGQALPPAPAEPREPSPTDQAIVEDEAVLDAEDRRVARRRALGIVGGTAAAIATIVGSILVLPL